MRDTAAPPEVKTIIDRLNALQVSLAVDFPPLTAILNLATEIRATMDPALRKRLDAMDLDFRERLYWSVVVPMLRDIGLKDPPPIIAMP